MRRASVRPRWPSWRRSEPRLLVVAGPGRRLARRSAWCRALAALAVLGQEDRPVGRPARALGRLARRSSQAAMPGRARCPSPCRPASTLAAAQQARGVELAVGAGAGARARRLDAGLDFSAARCGRGGRRTGRRVVPGAAVRRWRWPSISAIASVSVLSASVTASMLAAPAERRARCRGASRSTSRRASLHQLGRGPLVDGLEMRRHPGLQREAAQQRPAQAVDGHDVEAARQIEHAARTAGGRPLRVRAVGGAPVRSRSSAASRASSALTAQPASRCSIRSRHLRGGGLGEGEAQDALGSAPASSSRSTRSVSTRVLPVPALAVTQTERLGSAARRCAGVGAAHAVALRAAPLRGAGQMVVVGRRGAISGSGTGR